MSKDDAKIGIVGGAGPYAGLDLAQKILQQTRAKNDHDYLTTPVSYTHLTMPTICSV